MDTEAKNPSPTRAYLPTSLSLRLPPRKAEGTFNLVCFLGGRRRGRHVESEAGRQAGRQTGLDTMQNKTKHDKIGRTRTGRNGTERKINVSVKCTYIRQVKSTHRIHNTQFRRPG